MFSHQWTFFCSQSIIKFFERLTNPFQCISVEVHRYFFVYVNYGSEGGIEEIIEYQAQDVLHVKLENPSTLYIQHML